MKTAPTARYKTDPREPKRDYTTQVAGIMRVTDFHAITSHDFHLIPVYGGSTLQNSSRASIGLLGLRFAYCVDRGSLAHRQGWRSWRVGRVFFLGLCCMMRYGFGHGDSQAPPGTGSNFQLIFGFGSLTGNAGASFADRCVGYFVLKNGRTWLVH